MTGRVKQAEFMPAAAQAESLQPRVNLPIPEAYKGSINDKTILNYMYPCELYFRLVSIYDQYMQALFTVRLLQGPAYNWFSTLQYILDWNIPDRLDWPKFKNYLNDLVILGLQIIHLQIFWP